MNDGLNLHVPPKSCNIIYKYIIEYIDGQTHTHSIVNRLIYVKLRLWYLNPHKLGEFNPTIYQVVINIKLIWYVLTRYDLPFKSY